MHVLDAVDPRAFLEVAPDVLGHPEDAAQVGLGLLALRRPRAQLHERQGEGQALRDVAGELEHSGPHALTVGGGPPPPPRRAGC